MDAQVSEHTENHWPLYFKMVTAMIYEFYPQNKKKEDADYPQMNL